NMRMMIKSFFVPTALIPATSGAQAQSYNWNSRRVVVDPPTAAQRAAERAAADEEARRQEKASDAAGTTSGASNTASAMTQASGGSINGSYSTTFPLTENPIGEGGSWTNGGATVLAGPMCRRPPAFPSAPALSTPIRPQFSKVHGRKTSKYKQPSKFPALTVGPAAKKWNSAYARRSPGTPSPATN